MKRVSGQAELLARLDIGSRARIAGLGRHDPAKTGPRTAARNDRYGRHFARVEGPSRLGSCGGGSSQFAAELATRSCAPETLTFNFARARSARPWGVEALLAEFEEVDELLQGCRPASISVSCKITSEKLSPGPRIVASRSTTTESSQISR